MLRRLFSTIAPEPAALDHLPLNVANEPTAEQKTEPVGSGMTHAEKLALAAQRLGKPFACAGDGLPREIKTGVGGTETRVVGTKPAPAPEPQPPNVTAFGRKARA